MAVFAGIYAAGYGAIVLALGVPEVLSAWRILWAKVLHLVRRAG